MDSGQFSFVLPFILEKGLVEDDTSRYALASYPRDVISKATIIVVADFATRINEIDFSSKKKIKWAMEYLAVALSLPIENTDLMNVSRNIFRKWLEKPTIFGDIEKQNKYVRRIIKHLSLPFAFREPKPEIFKTTFNALLNTILNDFKYFHTTHGSWFSTETWMTIMNVLIGICDSVLNYDFQAFLPKNDIAKLRQKAVDTYFSTMQLSGLKDGVVWDRFFEYCKKWTVCFDFIRVWGKSLTKLFVFLNLRIYKPGFETQQQPFQEGVYSADNQISNEMVGFIFHHFVFAIDRPKMTQGAPELLKEFASNMFIITDTAQALGDVTSDFFVKRFPGIPFLKIFGSFFTFAPLLSESFDEPVSTLVNSIISIISNFQFEDNDPMISRLLAYIIHRCTPDHMPPLAMFLNSAFKLYRHNAQILPYVSNYALSMMPQLNPAKATRIVNDSFFTTCASLFFSATETLIHQHDIAPKYQAAFDMLWKNTTRSDVQFQLLSFASNLQIDVIEKEALFFNESTFRQMTTDSLNVPFISAMIYLLCIQIRINPEKTSADIVRLQLIQLIVTDVMKTDTNRLENFDSLACSVLQLLLSSIEWGVGIFTSHETLTVLYQFIAFVHSALKSNEKSKKSKSKEKSKENDKDNGQWTEKHKNFIQAYVEDLCGHINLHFPSKDHFTRRANSNQECNEENIAKMLGLKEYKTRYFSVQHHILISFIENNDGSGPLILLSRGPHGKAVFIVEENLRRGAADPVLSDFVKQEALPPVKAIKKVEPLITSVDNLGIVPTIENIDSDDDSMRMMYAKSFNEWLDISHLDYSPALLDKMPYKRPRVIDFITKMGFLIGNDNYSLRIFKTPTAVQESIKSIDQLDNSFFTPVLITHVLSTDRSLNILNLSTRMTSLMSAFLNEIAEPLLVDEEASSAAGLPSFKTPIPCLPLPRGYIAFVSPALVTNEIQAAKLKEVESYVKIIFNESDFDIKIAAEKKPKNLLLVIRPKGNGLYHVTQVQVPEEMYSSFADEQTLTARSIAFNISVCVEQFVHVQSKLHARVSHMKEKIIRELEEKEGITPNPSTVVDAFN